MLLGVNILIVEANMEKLKILVVDDESRMRMLVKDFLKRDGYDVLEASDGEAALDVFAKTITPPTGRSNL